MKLTPWFPPDMKPSRHGVYQVLFSDGICFAYWDDMHWHRVRFSAEDARAQYGWATQQDLQWRGIDGTPVDLLHDAASALMRESTSKSAQHILLRKIRNYLETLAL